MNGVGIYQGEHLMAGTRVITRPESHIRDDPIDRCPNGRAIQVEPRQIPLYASAVELGGKLVHLRLTFFNLLCGREILEIPISLAFPVCLCQRPLSRTLPLDAGRAQSGDGRAQRGHRLC